MMKAETDLGPRVSLLLNSLLLSSLPEGQQISQKLRASEPQDFLGKLGIIVLLRKNVKEFCHWFCQMLKVGKVLDDRCLCA